MEDPFDAIVNKLQEQIFDEAKDAYGEAGFDRWRNPKYNDRMMDCDTSARVTGSCGDTMEIFLKFAGGKVQSASYFTDGCASSSICGSFTVEMAIGKDPDELAEITGEIVLKKIGRFPDAEKHCAFLAAETLQEALRSYMVRLTTEKRTSSQ
jgi:nitrogen fixation NifU-like protein